MSNKLNPELKKQIENEAEKRSVGFDNKVSATIAGTEYWLGATQYAEKWQEAEQRAVTMAEVIEELMNIAYPNVPVLKKANQVLADYNTHKQSLTPKTSTDELHKEP